MFDQWEHVCYTHRWMADNMPPVYDTHGIEMSIWKEKNNPMYYLAEDHIYYDYDQEYIENIHEQNNYLDEDNSEYVDSNSSDSEYDDDSWYY